jgi:DNA modification methylase
MEVSKKARNKETDEKIEHMTVKPVILISHLIKLFTQAGQTVLDPFVGSGSHGVAALKNNRNFIGFEIEKKYFDIADRRLKREGKNVATPTKTSMDDIKATQGLLFSQQDFKKPKKLDLDLS